MAKLTINNFNGGEVSPYLYAREDVEKIYNKSCLKMENFVPLPYGGATKRPGLKYLGNSTSNNKARLIPFIFSVTENYILEFTNQNVRIWKNDSPHTASGGAEINLAIPHLEAELNDIQFTQSADILFLVHKNHPPYEIKRLGDTNWLASEVEWSFPPLLDQNTDSTITITTSAKSGETTLTASQDLFNSNMVGGYFSFEAARSEANLSLSKEFGNSDGISPSINVSNSDWDFETAGTWAGRINIDRSIDGGNSFEEYITVCDTRAVDNTNATKNFAVSSDEPEGNNTFLRVQFEKSTDTNLSSDCSVSIVPTKTTVNSLVRITGYNSPTSVVAQILSDFQDSIGDYTTEWAASTAFAEGAKVKFSAGLEYANIARDLSGFSGLCATVDDVSAADASRTAGTYDFVHGTTEGISSQISSSNSTTGPGTGARIRVVVDGSGAATVTMLGVSGKNYAVNNQFTITDAALGGGGAANLTFDVETISGTGGLDNMRGGAYGDAKYFAIDNARKVHVFTKDSSENFMPFDQWTATDINTNNDTGIDIAYYSNHVYVLGSFGNNRTVTHMTPGFNLTGPGEFRVYKYNLDGTGSALFDSKAAAHIDGGAGSSVDIEAHEQILYCRSIGVLNGKFYISYKHVGAGPDYDPRGPGGPYRPWKRAILIQRLSSTGTEEVAHYYVNDYDTARNYLDAPHTDPAGTPFISDITGVSDPSVNQIYCIDSENNQVSFFTPEFTASGSFDLSTDFSSTNVTGSFYDDTTDGSELFWVSDTTGNTKKYNFTTKAQYYECLLAVATNSGDFQTQLNNGHWFETSPEMDKWSEGAFSHYRGFPDTCAFFESRLVFAGTTNNPNTLWLSEIDNFFQFLVGTLDTSPMRLTINSGQLDGIQWLVPQKFLVIGTSGSEWALGSESDNKPVTPTSFELKRKTTYGSAATAGLLVNSAVLFLMRQGKKVREWIFNFDAQDYVAPDLTLLSEHISEDGFKVLTYQQQPDNIIWTINSENDLVGMTYERDQDVIGWHRQKCTGDFESVMVLPSEDGADQVYAVIKLTVNSADTRYICKLDEREWGTDYTSEYNGLDYYKTFTNLATGTISNYDYAIGETYTVVADGVEIGTGTVDSDGDLNIGTATSLTISSASIVSNEIVINFSAAHNLSVGDTINIANLGFTTTDPNGKYILDTGDITDSDTVTIALTGDNETFTVSGSTTCEAYLFSTTYSKVVIGKKFTSTLAPLYLNYQGRYGSTVGSKANASMATIRFKDTVSAKCGQTEASSDLQPVKFQGTGMVSETAEVYLSNAPEYLQTVYIVSDEPVPCTVLSMTPRVDTGGVRT